MERVIREDIIKLSVDADLKSLTKLQDEINDLKKKLTGDMGGDALDDLKDSANESVKPLKKLKEQAEEVVKKVTEVGKKAATTAFNGLKKVVGVSFNALKNAISKTATKLTELGKKAATTAFNGLKKVAGVSFKALTVGLGAAATAVGALVTKSVQAYADYEQLVGGVETLFGTGGLGIKEYAQSVGKTVDEVKDKYDSLKAAESDVMKNANNAYKTAGLSANDYMNTVTSFSASLISSLGGDTKKAAAIADKAITDMADNSNKMGTEMDSIIQTYQSLARGNYAIKLNSRAA